MKLHKIKKKENPVPGIALGINIDHIATLRQARLGNIPGITAAAVESVRGGANQITIHLREDRRHIQDRDLPDLLKILRPRGISLNLEMAVHSEIAAMALRYRPEKVCLVPEKRRELTTEGGLDVVANESRLKRLIPKLHRNHIRVSLFVDPVPAQIRAAARVEADAVEIHTGRYAGAAGSVQKKELKRIRNMARLGKSLGLVVHAGHGLDYQNVKAVARIPEILELNIGYSVICRAVFAGLRRAVFEMKQTVQQARRSCRVS